MLQQIPTPAATACGIRVGTTVRAVSANDETTGMITRIETTGDERLITVNIGPLDEGRGYGQVFIEGKVALTPIATPEEGDLLVINRGLNKVVGIAQSQQGACDWLSEWFGGNADFNDYGVAPF